MMMSSEFTIFRLKKMLYTPVIEHLFKEIRKKRGNGVLAAYFFQQIYKFIPRIRVFFEAA